MKQLISCFAVIVLCFVGSMSQVKRRNSAKQTNSKVPIELVRQIIQEFGLKEYVDSAWKGSVVEFSRNLKVERVDLNKDKIPEFIIIPPFLCGNTECTLLVYQKTDSGYRSLTEDGISIEPNTSTRNVAGSTYTNGHLDLYGRALVFDGRYYRINPHAKVK